MRVFKRVIGLLGEIIDRWKRYPGLLEDVADQSARIIEQDREIDELYGEIMEMKTARLHAEMKRNFPGAFPEDNYFACERCSGHFADVEWRDPALPVVAGYYCYECFLKISG